VLLRLAIVSPLPPSPTGIADYTIDVTRALRSSHAVDLFHDPDQGSVDPKGGAFPIGDLLARAAAEPYHAVIYQMGNAPAHDFMYEWMERVPGVVVLHDLVLHHSFARRYLESPESRAYAADPSNHGKRMSAEKSHASYLEAVEKSYPGTAERLKDAHFNSAGDLLLYAFPLFKPAIAHALAVGVHNSCMAAAVQAARPDLECSRLAMPAQAQAVSAGAVAALRTRLGLSLNSATVGCFGLVTREKRIETVARAIARLTEIHPTVRLLLAGPVSDAPWLDALLERTGVSPRAVVAGRLEPDDFAAAMALTDAVVHLRYPTGRETSAALLRVMAQGRPVVISDLANQKEIPHDVARRVDSCDEEGDLTRALDAILTNRPAAEAMGERARRFVALEHSEVRTRETYEQLLKSLPSHYSPSRP
jgi:glycosyltransferase involved in cell wall biosynthesis